jgi:hypothetical protein
MSDGIEKSDRIGSSQGLLPVNTPNTNSLVVFSSLIWTSLSREGVWEQPIVTHKPMHRPTSNRKEKGAIIPPCLSRKDETKQEDNRHYL